MTFKSPPNFFSTPGERENKKQPEGNNERTTLSPSFTTLLNCFNPYYSRRPSPLANDAKFIFPPDGEKEEEEEEVVKNPFFSVTFVLTAGVADVFSGKLRGGWCCLRVCELSRGPRKSRLIIAFKLRLTLCLLNFSFGADFPGNGGGAGGTDFSRVNFD